MFFVYYILIFSLLWLDYVEGKVSQRAGLLFDESGAFAVNGDSLLYRRVADTSALVKAAGQTADLTLIYYALCSNVEKLATPLTQREKNTRSPSEIVYKATPMPFPLRDSARACSMMGGRLPEGRSERACMLIQRTAVETGVSAVVAGIEWDFATQIHRYISDKSVVHAEHNPEVEYGGDYTGSHHIEKWDGYYVKKMSGRYQFMYKYVNNKFGIRMMDENDRNYQQRIVCEFPPDPLAKEPPQVSDNMLYKLAAHNCRRDKNVIIGTTAFTLAEVDTITQLNFTQKRKRPSYKTFFPQISLYSDNTTIYDHITFTDKEKEMYDSRTQVVRMAPSLLPYYDFVSTFHTNDTTTRFKRDNKNTMADPAMRNYVSLTLDKLERSIDYNDFALLPDFHFDLESEIIVNQSRSKRDVTGMDPVIAAGIEAGVTDLGQNSAPLAFVGEIMSHLFGVVTRRNDLTVAKMVKISKAVENLSVNQALITDQFEMIKDRVKFFQQQSLTLLEGTAILTMVNDLKMHVMHMQTLLQVTMSKYAHILMSASIGRTSPYALKRQEIMEFSRSLPRARWLVEDLSRVTTTAAIIDNQLNLVFRIPVLSDEDMYTLYKVAALPTFRDNVTLFPVLDTEHVAISKSGNRYIEFTEDEYQQCLNHPDSCTAARPTRPTNERANCVIRTFATRKLHCRKHREVEGQVDFIYKKERRVFFSVPHKINLFVKCLDNLNGYITNDTNVDIENQGELTFRPACTITLPDGSSFRSRVESEIVDLTELPIFSVLKFNLEVTNITIDNPYKHLMEIQKLDLVPVEVPTIDDILAETFKPSTMITALIHLAMWTPIIFMIGLILYCCYPKIKECMNKREPTEFSVEMGKYPPAPHTKGYETDNTESNSTNYSARVASLRDYVSSVFTRPVPQTNSHRRGSRDSTDSWIDRVENRIRHETPPPRIHRV